MQTPEDIVNTFLKFYSDRGHAQITGSTLIPRPEDAVLFTTSGMHPLTPYLEGEPHPQGRRLVNLQRCLRTTDLDEVGDDTHLTVFGMLGSWSLGDYSGSESLSWGLELLTKGFGIPVERLYVTVFAGDGPVPSDEPSKTLWKALDIPFEELVQDNWWSNGETGPCGPDSEIFVWTGSGGPVGTPSSNPLWVEVWNHVMMRYRREKDGSISVLPQQNVDTGMGLERLLMVLEGKESVYETSMFLPWVETLPPLWGVTGNDLRLLSDHLRSSIVTINDGVMFSNTGRGYVLRRLVRRALTRLWQNDPSLTLGSLPASLYEHTFTMFRQEGDVTHVQALLLGEEKRFRSLVERGRKVVQKRLQNGPLTGEDFKDLHQTHGLPKELVENLLT